MLDSDERVVILGKTILNDARECADKIIEDAKLKCENIVNRAKKESEKRINALVLHDKEIIASQYAKEISAFDFDAHKQVIAHRTRLVNELFDKVSERIVKFSETEQYKKFLENLLLSVDKEKKFSNDTVVFLSKKDSIYANEIKNKFNVQVDTDKDIKLGGASVYYPSDSIYIDKTIDSSLVIQRREFVNNTAFSL